MTSYTDNNYQSVLPIFSCKIMSVNKLFYCPRDDIREYKFD